MAWEAREEEIRRLREAYEMLLTDIRRNDVDMREMLAENERLQDQVISGQNDGYDMAKNTYCTQIIELEDENAKLREEQKLVRDVLASTDILSLPHDYPIERMAADRMRTLNERTLEGLALFGENEELRAALKDFVNVMNLLSMRVGLTVGEVADHINPVVDKARAALGGDNG